MVRRGSFVEFALKEFIASFEEQEPDAIGKLLKIT